MAGQGGSAASLSQQIVTYISYPFASCLPSSSRNTNSFERQGLLSEANYDDSDAISLLSNIRDRSRRRSRSSRRREEWSKRAATVGCGLFGRPKGQIARREVTGGDGVRSQHRRSASEDSATSRTSDDNGGPALSATGSFSGAQESGDEDAGMLEDEDIAEISQSRDGEEGEIEAQRDVPTVHISAADEDEEQREAAERAAIKAKVDKQAEEEASLQAEDVARLAAEEEALAAEEEAAIAKAKRKAERRAKKEALIREQSRGQRERSRTTESNAEAAAGGFDFGEEGHRQDARGYDYRQEEDPPQYGVSNEEEEYKFQNQQYHDHHSAQLQQPEVVHHHHYYHEPPPEEEEQYDETLLSPNFRIQELPTFSSAGQDTKETTFEEDEDDADIAGITFSKNKKRQPRGGEGGSQTHSNGRSVGSGSGSRQSGSALSGQGQSRYEAHRRDSDRSAEADSGQGGGSSASGKRSYRDRPRRHERKESRSTGSGAVAREGVPSRTMARSPTIAESEDRAEAAAGGFDDFVPSTQAFHDEQDLAGYRAKERRSFGDQGSASSSAHRRERQREGPVRREGGLNAPRNPLGPNIFI